MRAQETEPDRDLENYRTTFEVFSGALRYLNQVVAQQSLDNPIVQQSVESPSLKGQIDAIVRQVHAQFEEELRRQHGRYAISDKTRANFYTRNKGRVDNAVNTRIAALKSGIQPVKKVSIPVIAKTNEVDIAKADLKAAKDLLYEAARPLKGRILTDVSLLNEGKDPRKTYFYRGTNLEKVAVDPYRLEGKDRRIHYFEPGIYEGVQCFSGPGNLDEAKNYALNPQLHGMHTLRNNHPDAVVVELAIDIGYLHMLQGNGSAVLGSRYGRDETLFSDKFLTSTSFRIFDAHSL